MEYVADAAEMRRADDNTIEYFGVPQLVLMERAALTARDVIVQKWPGMFKKDLVRILIAAGSGNNGADGAALARLFSLEGFDVTVLVSGEEEKYSSALKTQIEILRRYLAAGSRIASDSSAGEGDNLSGGESSADKIALRIMTDSEWRQEKENTASYDLSVDALFGIGLSRPVTGIYREKIEWLNSLSGKKAALDIPSGLSAQDGSVLGCAFCADITITFGFLKRGMLLYPGRSICGEVKVTDIGITKESFPGSRPAGITINKRNPADMTPFMRRIPDSHKGSYGKVLLFAGSADAPGAALLAGEAVFRSGAGMLQIVSSPENRDIVMTRLPEAMYQTLRENTDWKKMLIWCDAVVIGPGIGQDTSAKRGMENILTHMSEMKPKKPLILDADGLNLSASSEKISGYINKYTACGGIVIMTPHMAEFARLLHCSIGALQASRFRMIESFCRETGVILVSKDAASVVGFTDENDNFRYYINQTGNSGMATAGSGDVLAGITGALAAFTAVRLEKNGENKKAAFFRAAYRAVYLHGLSGDAAASEYGETSMKAGDMLAALPELLKAQSITPPQAAERAWLSI